MKRESAGEMFELSLSSCRTTELYFFVTPVFCVDLCHEERRI